MHRLLQRQLKKQFPTGVPPELSALLEDISNSYQDFDEDYKRLERILEISSQELFKTNQLLNAEKERIESKLEESEEKAHTAELIIKNSPTILVRWTPNFKLNIEYITENISHLGYDAKNWINEKIAFTDFIHPDDVKTVTRRVLQSFREKSNGWMLFTG